MSIPFAPGSWSAGARILLTANTVIREAFLDPVSGALFAQGVSTKDGDPEPGRTYLTGFQWLSGDFGGSWSLVADTLTDALGPVDIGRGGFYNTFSINGLVYRFRVIYVSATNVNNGTLYPGSVTLEYAGMGSNPVQTFLSWGQYNKTGGVSPADHASLNFDAAGPVTIPGSGPQGQDADWLMIACKVTSPPDVVVNTLSMWRSTDYGQSWTMIRELKNQFGFGDGSNGAGFLVRNPGTKRLLSGANSSVYFSDDNGVTWAQAMGVNFLAKTSPTLHPGNTWNYFEIPGLSSIGGNAVSCDDGSTWADPNVDIVIPASSRGSGVKLGPQEILFVHPKALPEVLSTVWWSDNGGELFRSPGDIGTFPDSAVYMGLTPSGHPVVVGRNGYTAYSTDVARGSFTKRTFCSLASAKVAAAKRLVVCGHPIANNVCE